jgi:secretion/DNA translocation related TadE-like protein
MRFRRRQVPPRRAPEARGRRCSRRTGEGIGRTDSGAAAIYVLVLVAAMTAAALTTLAAGQALAVRHRAGAAADLAALAAADRVLEGAGSACAHGDSIARANGARLVRCQITGDAVDVLVEISPAGISLPAGVPGLPSVRARARAAPTDADPIQPGFTGGSER